MYKIFFIFLFCTLFSSLFAQNVLFKDKSLQNFIQKHSTIVLGTGDQWDPYVIKKNDGSVTGYDHDILQWINYYTGAHFVLKSGNWSKMQTLAREKKIDGLATLLETKARQHWFNFSHSYVTIQKTVLVRQNSLLPMNDPESLAYKTIAVLRGNALDVKLAKKLKMDIVYVSSQEEAFQAVITGKTDAVFGNTSSDYFLGKLGFPHLKKVYTFKESSKLKFAVRKDWPEALVLLNKGLEQIPQSEFWRLKQKWFSKYNNIDSYVPLSHKERVYLLKKKEIKMCVDPYWMPFEQINKYGEYEGILADFSRLFSEKLNTPFILEKTKNYQESRRFLREGKCDIIMGDSPSKEVSGNYLVTQPYLNIARAFVTHTDTKIVHDFSQLVSKGEIGVLLNSQAQHILPKLYPDIKMIPFKTEYDALKAVSSKKILSFVNLAPALIYTIQKYGLANVEIAGFFSTPVSLAILVHKEEDELFTILNKMLSTITERERQSIMQKWVQVKYETGKDTAFLVKIFLISVLILMFVLLAWYHTYRLKHKLTRQHEALTLQMEEEIQKNKEHQLFILQQNRLAQKGEILNMIAHQWRQPLNTLALVSQTLVLKYKQGKIDEKVISVFNQKSQQIIQQMSHTINDFKNFFKPEKSKTHFLLNEAVEHSVLMVKPLLEHANITLDIRAEKKIWFTGFPNEFGQAVINIVNNAKDALLENEIENPNIEIKLYEENETIRLTICDNAGGVPKEILPKIFDPYFSTKDEKNGSGLGLYMCKIIIEDHIDGELYVSNHREGACFEIILYPL